jgi:hypothetical protein
MVTQKIFGQLLEKVTIDSPPCDIRGILIEVFRETYPGKPESEISELAEKGVPSVISAVLEDNNNRSLSGIPKRIELNSSSEDYLQGAAYIEGKEPEPLRELKTRRAQLGIYETFLRSITFGEFEKLCMKILSELGVENIRITKKTRDQGIDFFGNLPLYKHIFPDDINPTIQKQLRVWVIGQAKRYSRTTVSTPELRELVGSVELAIGKAFPDYATGDFTDLKVRVCDPVLYIFMTTGEISKDSWELKNKSGIILINSAILAGFLADRNIALLNGEVSEDDLKSWINT